MEKQNLIQDLLDYKTDFNEENEMVHQTIDYLRQTDDYLGKINPKGHITGSAWIISKDRKKALLTHHFKLNKWLQLGGHTELNETVIKSAEREGVEESGLKSLKLLHEDIFDVDVHLIPERKGVDAHYHYDIRFLFEADANELIEVSDESHDVKWVDLENINDYSNSQSIIRMVNKTRRMI
ncbi:MAG: NUDIX hydrolase [Clostridia bacterium]|nr:NUDIX hydrolase [Clostridia bacterium]